MLHVRKRVLSALTLQRVLHWKFVGGDSSSSAVIFVAKAGAVRFDDDIVRNSSDGLETRVLCCEKIASPAPKTLRAAGEALAKD